MQNALNALLKTLSSTTLPDFLPSESFNQEIEAAEVILSEIELENKEETPGNMNETIGKRGNIEYNI